ncbi:MAG: DUF2127 domain-containing protein [Gammaproteobacteria bacterium]|nr:DUF2127 domain-containing protein [Gammaproteobacteria bacterium]MDE2345435.1 DUF2127 domain-containing protein [Gammaproteobacteria bacterium]
MSSKSRKYLHRLFILSVVAKGLDGVLESIAGVIVFSTSRLDLKNLVIMLTAPELGEDPTDLVANFMRHVVSGLTSNTKYFVAAYLLVNGLVKTAVAAGLISGRNWVFRPVLALLAIFITYQLFRFTNTHSLILLGFTCLDLLVLLFIWAEYRARLVVV